MKAVSIKTHIDGKHKKTSSHIKYQLPSYIVEKYPMFVEFLEHYYIWMEREGSPLGDSYRLPEYLDIDKTRDDFLEFFLDEYMPNIPNEVLVDKRLLIKHIVDFYSAKGTEKSFRFLFRILFNKEIEFEYPASQILRASDGIWVKETFIKIAFLEKDYLLNGRKLFGTTSGATGYVDSVFKENEQITNVKIKGINGVFLPSEAVETRDDMDKITSYVSGQVRTIEVLHGGFGYEVGETIVLDDSSFYEVSNIVVNSVDINGTILSIEIQNTGSGYINTYTKSNVNLKGAVLKVYVGGVYYDTGKFVTEQGKLNSICKLQDGKVYQEFSYIIKSDLPLKQYIDYVMNMVHPAGMHFSSVTLLNDVPHQTNISSGDVYYDIEFTNPWITVNDLERQNPNQSLLFYLNKLLNSFIYRIYIKTFECEITQSLTSIPFTLLLEGGDSLITDDGDFLEL